MDNPEKLYCPFLISPLVFSKVYSLQSVLCLVYTMLTVSLDCPFLISPLVFSKVYSLPQDRL
jgi:hypothetical protein